MTKHALSYNIIEGSGPGSIVYLHGFLGDKREWESLHRLNFPRQRALFIDLPGHGDSAPFDEKDNAFEQTAEQIIQLMNAEAFTASSLVAYSMGGRVALYMVCNHPELFSKVVIESAFPGFEGATSRAERINTDEKRSKSLCHKGLGEFVASWYGGGFFRSLTGHPDFHTLTVRRSQGLAKHRAWAVLAFSPGRQPNLWPMLKTLPMPILWVAGSLDLKYVKIAERGAELCPRGEAVVIEGAGHNVHFECPLKLGPILTRFLA